MASDLWKKVVFVPAGEPCGFCRTTDMPLSMIDGATSGVCEACAVHLYWAWRKVMGDAPPVKAPPQAICPSRVKVLVLRLRPEAKSRPYLPESYEVSLVEVDGGKDLPSADVREGEGETDAVLRALEEAGLGTWPLFVEPLYTGHTPRGALARVYLATVWYKDPKSVSKICRTFEAWPPSAHAPAMVTFYAALDEVIPMRLWKMQAASSRWSSLGVEVRRAAVDYVAVKEAEIWGEPDVDTSMLEILRRGMTEEEWQVCEEVTKDAARRAKRDAQVASDEPRPGAGVEPPAAPETGEELPDDGGEDDDELTDDAFRE